MGEEIRAARQPLENGDGMAQSFVAFSLFPTA